MYEGDWLLKRRHVFTIAIAALILQGLPSIGLAAPCTLDEATATTIDPTPLIPHCDADLRWNLATNRLAFAQVNSDGYYRILTMRPDGSDLKPLTGDKPGLPAGHHGAAYWHPSGKYLVFVAEKPGWHGATMFGNPDYGALPGFGVHDDLWMISADGSKYWRLTNDPDTKFEGELLPVISPDGKKIAWSSRQARQVYVIKVADFVATPQPHLENIRQYQPGGAAYYEPGSFTSDSKSLVYTSNADTHTFWASQIYRLNLASGRGVRLTHDNSYNEHPVIVKTPTGDWVVYMSDKGSQRFPFHLSLGTDWYAMRIDGSDVKRLTTMNRRDNPESVGRPMVATTVAISPDGKYMLGNIQDSLTRQTGLVKIVRFTGP